jgi:hypothetical protein
LATRSSQREARSSAKGDNKFGKDSNKIEQAGIKIGKASNKIGKASSKIEQAGNKGGRTVSSLRVAKRGHGANKMLQITRTIADMTFAQKQITLSHGSRRTAATSESDLTKNYGNGNGKLQRLSLSHVFFAQAHPSRSERTC